MFVCRNHCQNIIGRNDFIILIGDLSVPANFTVTTARTQRLLLASKPNFERVAKVDRLSEAQVVHTVVRKYWPELGLDE